ncbi:alpha-L-fucosidase [Puteibacter caeruleilacunae]|nr:alpha-L-fucosidase [Puteibacter caeruleilacunae]
MKRIIIYAMLILCVACTPKEKNKEEQSVKKYKPKWESLKQAPVAPWFDDAKFGIFIHWGGYSVIGHRKGGRGYAEHVPKILYTDTAYYYPYMRERFGGCPPDFGYKDIVKQFKAEKWNPDEWAALFNEAGARYVVLTAEHHDGYALWDSDLTDWCATKVGPMRDLVGDLGKAVRAKGMKYAPSYHRERHPGFFAKDIYKVNSMPKDDIAKEIELDPSAAGLYGPSFSYDDEFIADYAARWKEVQDKYQPDFMWIDDIPIFYKVDPHPQSQKFQDSFQNIIADYFNAAEEWGKDVYLNNKGAHLNWPEGPGCMEKDNLNLTTIGPKWENPATLGTSYGYMKEEEINDDYKSPEELIHLLCDVVSKNGNLLLNIGPRADGTIPEGMQERLLEMGKWLKINGDAIYDSRPWSKFGEGSALVQDDISGNDISGKKKAKARKIPYSEKSIRYTTSKDKSLLYAMQLVRADNNSCLAKLVTKSSLKDKKIVGISLLGSNEKVDWKLTDEGLRMKVNSMDGSIYTRVWKIELK